MGSALLAGLAVGFWSSQEEVARSWQESRRFDAASDRPGLAATRARWAEAVPHA
jgi:glycerol kinase